MRQYSDGYKIEFYALNARNLVAKDVRSAWCITNLGASEEDGWVTTAAADGYYCISTNQGQIELFGYWKTSSFEA